MIVLIPIGGIGQRFKDNGYSRPKALINVFGNTIISYLLDNLNKSIIDYIFIPYNKEYQKFRFEEMLKKNYPEVQFKFFRLEENTRGAAETINIGLTNLKEERDIPILCLDSDNFFVSDIVEQWNGENCIFTIKDTNPKPIFSYVQSDENSIIHDIREKDKISDFASTGAYGFQSIQDLLQYTQKIIDNNIVQKNEFYTSGVIKEMIKDGKVFKNKVISNDDFICLGTPQQLKFFYNQISLKKYQQQNHF